MEAIVKPMLTYLLDVLRKDSSATVNGNRVSFWNANSEEKRLWERLLRSYKGVDTKQFYQELAEAGMEETTRSRTGCPTLVVPDLEQYVQYVVTYFLGLADEVQFIRVEHFQTATIKQDDKDRIVAFLRRRYDNNNKVWIQNFRGDKHPLSFSFKDFENIVFDPKTQYTQYTLGYQVDKATSDIVLSNQHKEGEVDYKGDPTNYWVITDVGAYLHKALDVLLHVADSFEVVF